MQALIDGDIVAYRCSASAENDPVEIAILRADKLMRDIIEETKAIEYMTFLTGKNNFRKEINPEYKANRKDKPKPIHLATVNSFLESEWNAKVTDGYEADDALGMYQNNNTILCSIDKDLLMIPGIHYNFVTKEFKEAQELDCLHHFYKQALIGDKADNIFGVDGIGKIKASKLIEPIKKEKDMYNRVCGLYNDPDRLEINLNCLWIWRNEGELWSDRFGL